MFRWTNHQLIDDLRETKRHRHVDTTITENTPYLPNGIQVLEIMQTDPEAARWLPHGRNFPTDGTPLTEYQQFFADELDICVDLMSNETVCRPVIDNTELNENDRLRTKARCVCNHVVSAVCVNVALGSRSTRANNKHKRMETICNSTYRPGHEKENCALRMMDFFNFLRYLSPYVEIHTYDIFNKNVENGWKMQRDEFFQYGLYHEDWRDTAAIPARDFTVKREVEGLYYPHFRALDRIYHRFRFPDQRRRILTGITEPFKIGYDQQFDFDNQPGRPYSSATSIEGRVNEKIPFDVF